jgi:NADH:ubiquinone oxidoreductase subunit K
VDFNNTPIAKLWWIFKWMTTWAMFILSLVLWFWAIVIFVSDHADFIVGIVFAVISVSLTVAERSLARSLTEEKFHRKQEVNEEQEN